MRAHRQSYVIRNLFHEINLVEAVALDVMNEDVIDCDHIGSEHLSWVIEGRQAYWWEKLFGFCGTRHVTKAIIGTPERHSIISGMNWYSSAIRAVIELNTVEDIELCIHSKIDYHLIDRLTELPHLTRLSLWGRGIDDEMLGHIGNITTLKQLSVEGVHVTDRGIACLAGLTGLQSLLLRDIALNGEPLRDIRSLRELRLERCRLSADCFRSLGACATLRSLGIFDSPFGEKDPLTTMSITARAASPVTLSVSISEMDDAILSALCARRPINEIDLHGCNGITSDGLEVLQALPLKKVTLLCPSLGNGIFGQIAKASSIRSLRLAVRCPVDDPTQIADLRLEDFELELTHPTEVVLRQLAGVPALQELTVRYMSLDDESVKALANLKGLTRLNLAGGGVSTELASFLRSSLPRTVVVYSEL